MKQWSRFMRNIFSSFILILSPTLFYSCDVHNFSSPQPTDKENIYEFPKEFEGAWHSENELGASYIVTKEYALVISQDTDEIANGAWPKLNEKGEYVGSLGYESLKTINYDSLKRPIDTTDNYILKPPLIYEVDEHGDLGKGYLYAIQKDHIIIFRNDTTCIDLGQNAFLRQVNENMYVLNIHNTILGVDFSSFENWWQVVLLEKNEDKSIEWWEYSEKIGGLGCMFHTRSIFKEGNVFYFDCQWTKADLLRMVKEGYFKPSFKLLRTQ